MAKFAETFLKKMVEENIMSEKFLIDWNEKNIRLDKDSVLYDKKAERKFRELVENFIQWIGKIEYVDASDEEEEDEAKPADPKEEEKVADEEAD